MSRYLPNGRAIINRPRRSSHLSTLIPVLMLGGLLHLLLPSHGLADPDDKRTAAPSGQEDQAPSAVAERSLKNARAAYAKSEFGRCIEQLQRAEVLLRQHLAGATELALMKRINQWLGLCEAVGGASDAAILAFLRGARLPGAGEDPRVFPPSVWPHLRAAEQQSRGTRCRLVLSTEQTPLQLDGQLVLPGQEVELGEHYAVWGSGQRRSDRIRIGNSCRLELSSGETSPAGGQGTSIATTGGSGSARQKTTHPPWYRRWWVWTLIGAATAATATAITVPLVVGREHRSFDLVF